MTLALWVKIALSVLGIGGAGFSFYWFIVKPIMDWGASKEREDRAAEQNYIKDEVIDVAKDQIKILGAGDVPLDDLRDSMRKNNL